MTYGITEGNHGSTFLCFYDSLFLRFSASPSPQTPQLALQTPQIAHQAPQLALQTPQMALKTPQLALQTSQMALRTPKQPPRPPADGKVEKQRMVNPLPLPHHNNQ